MADRRMLALLLWLSCAAPLSGATIIVAGDGSGDSRRLAAVVRRASPGDTIVLRGRSLQEDGVWNVDARSGLRYRGESLAKARLRVSMAKDVEISHLFIRGPVHIQGSRRISIRDCLIEPEGPRLPYDRDDRFPHQPDLVRVIDSPGVLIERCRIMGGQGSGVAASGSVLQIKDSLLAGSWGGGVCVSDLGGRTRTGKVRLSGNTIAMNNNLQPGFDPGFIRAHPKLGLDWAWVLSRGAGVFSGQKRMVLEDNAIVFNDRGIALQDKRQRIKCRRNLLHNASGDDDAQVCSASMNSPQIRLAAPDQGDYRILGGEEAWRQDGGRPPGAPGDVAGPEFMSRLMLNPR